jgi:hypothetical protein
MDVDEAWRDDFSSGIDDLVCGGVDAGFDRRNLSVLNANVSEEWLTTRAIEHLSVLNQKLVMTHWATLHDWSLFDLCARGAPRQARIVLALTPPQISRAGHTT